MRLLSQNLVWLQWLPISSISIISPVVLGKQSQGCYRWILHVVVNIRNFERGGSYNLAGLSFLFPLRSPAPSSRVFILSAQNVHWPTHLSTFILCGGSNKRVLSHTHNSERLAVKQLIRIESSNTLECATDEI
ncbi:hypothetical protein GYMLUDRAFT_439456 [Collybiopsis luxurians FD-317 M1]|uniref:Uncharacterized protein n=1 Tax=Collybiopsis luxurians FD-317 M1 TaxID=944289 RepID=A0A0D0BYU8_9AGAR|nr:hypothetical protein GYMLUDRAFT_439456 [Collybiopsis luxurians FD-317 M1]